MTSVTVFAAFVWLLIVARWAAQLWLQRLNRRHVLAHAGAVPETFRHVMDEAAYARSVQYTLAKGRLEQVEATWDAAVLLAVLFSAVLPWGFQRCAAWLGCSAWAMGAFLLATGVALSLLGLPASDPRYSHRTHRPRSRVARPPPRHRTRRRGTRPASSRAPSWRDGTDHRARRALRRR